MTDLNILLVGANGGIGSAILDRLLMMNNIAHIHACTRVEFKHDHPLVTTHHLDYADEGTIEMAVRAATENAPLDIVIIATGILHDGGDVQPEKSLRDLSTDKYQTQFLVNCIGPALVAKYAAPKLNRAEKSVFAALSARVGSISDNHLGGWYAYRAAKAALNMTIKNTAIEIALTNKNAVIIGLHPGTVDTNLSKPFQSHVAEGKLFTPDYAAEKLLDIVFNATPNQSGNLYAWDGQRIEF